MAGKLLEAVEISVENGINEGRIDEKRDAATIEMLKHMAEVLDSDQTGQSSVMRYVSPASFLSYCEKLGFVPEINDQIKPKRIDKNSKLHIVGNSQWKRA